MQDGKYIPRKHRCLTSHPQTVTYIPSSGQGSPDFSISQSLLEFWLGRHGGGWASPHFLAAAWVATRSGSAAVAGAIHALWHRLELARRRRQRHVPLVAALAGVVDRLAVAPGVPEQTSRPQGPKLLFPASSPTRTSGCFTICGSRAAARYLPSAQSPISSGTARTFNYAMPARLPSSGTTMMGSLEAMASARAIVMKAAPGAAGLKAIVEPRPPVDR